MEHKSKAETYIGFAIKAWDCKIGANAIDTIKSAKLIIVCKSASSNTVEQAKKFSKKFHCPLIITVDKLLENIVHKLNAKIMAICNEKLASAILENSENHFTEIL